jgi:hypothetical protein
VFKHITGVIESRRQMGRICSTYGGDALTGFWWGNLKEEDHLEHPSVDRKIILKLIFEKWDGAMDWMDITVSRDRWRAFMSEVMNLRVP